MTPSRDPEATRRHILEVTAQAMCENGYKATSLSDIIDKAGVSKGALYHHFANKQELGHAVFEEVYVKQFLDNWSFPCCEETPLESLAEWINQLSSCVTAEDLKNGCPVCNMANEMSGIDEVFRLKSAAMFKVLTDRVTTILALAKEKGVLKTEVEPAAVANFLVIAIQGYSIQGKYSRDIELGRSTVKCMADYVLSLRVDGT
ncbi:TetR/AcrR family transcriptional regulator [Teredinibacter sp. KSP-S5-2]|uniref:TetR/AcrR family transcriptional regulator n=1 Tax=Teredinibacter sp. KSP-S5-2 TaxID=3034506 RepID=UPI00293447FA|nr:TetR/AcrR family transcriptional regulator [Teredinibacter sp. KSP-S5-2]WNO07515.1 TetR/AcrR family transcriptional regulator [Teredinibacter sp. KSP-S5-2]